MFLYNSIAKRELELKHLAEEHIVIIGLNSKLVPIETLKWLKVK